MSSSKWLLAVMLTATGCGDFFAEVDSTQPVPYIAPPPRNAQAPDEGSSEASPAARFFNPYVKVAYDPFSTFAADVDSASYDIFVKSMTEGAGLPGAPTVRSEEFMNVFTYEYPAPSSRSPHPFEIDLDFGVAPAGGTMLLRVGVQGRDMLADRAPANLVFLVDVSGSMSAQDKLPVAKDMLRAALDALRPTDKVSMVTYAGSVRVALPPTEVRHRDTIDRAIADLDAGGSTAGADGLQLAYDQAEAGFVEGGINHIIMCTDGDFNVGPYTTIEIVQLVEDRRAGGVTFTVLGFGLGNLNDEMMEAVSNAGNGIYRVIGGKASAGRYVSHKLLSDVVHIAKDVKLQVEFNPEHVYAYRQVGYENRQLADDEFRDDAVDAGEIGSGHQMTALYEVVLAGGALPELPESAPRIVAGDPVEGEREVRASELVMVKLRYKSPGATEADPATEMRVGLDAEGTDRALDAESEFAWAVATIAGRLSANPFVTDAQFESARARAEAETGSERGPFGRLVAELPR